MNEYNYVAVDPHGNVVARTLTKREAKDAAAAVCGTWRPHKPAEVYSIMEAWAEARAARECGLPQPRRAAASQRGLFDAPDIVDVEVVQPVRALPPPERKKPKAHALDAFLERKGLQRATPTSRKAHAEDDAPRAARGPNLGHRPLRQAPGEAPATFSDRCIRAAKAGNTAAYYQAAELYRGQLEGMAMRYVGNRATAADVVQDAFLRGWDKLADFDPDMADSSLIRWLSRLVTNRALDTLRRAKVTRAKSTEDEGVEAEIASAYTDDAETPFQATALSQRKVRIATALAQLPEYQREVMQLLGEGLEYKDIAAALNISINTVSSRASRGKTAMWILLGSQGRDLLQNPTSGRHGRGAKDTGAEVISLAEAARKARSRGRAWALATKAVALAHGPGVKAAERGRVLRLVRGIA